MSFTMNAILEEAIDKIEPRVDIFTTNIAEAAIDGARGNSGVLIAQYFVGFSEGCENKEKLDKSSCNCLYIDLCFSSIVVIYFYEMKIP